MFKRAIVRTPAKTMTQGLSNAGLGLPDYHLALQQHQQYIITLENCGVEVLVLPPADDFPDSCFVEDAALLTERMAVLTRPGAESRQGEVELLEESIRRFYSSNIVKIQEPGTLDAGDVLRVENHFYIGLSARSNMEGAKQLITLLNNHGYTASVIPLHKFLHLKTGVSYIGNGYLLVGGELINHPEWEPLKQITVEADEAYAANCILVNDYLLIPSGFSKISLRLKQLGHKLVELDCSEFRKLDGGLSCLSLRF
ncbi:NG,NG-dimethylarginine dimethylaminohydrolase [Legionella birminghamensis]|uniref:NG,NG-dimethylarginine dimethylaminohydrolase n=1 Tax=Legionella birminghamensis TaxID=28083 RepID=A0A378I7Q3_9GAMM|nr:arginine deiminase-related protein [Legionella birminghamensis]KTC68044.1 NG,NG-dimethylarginine dimethylaminohydrolase [Legionella birminghamensis]STX31247.1 NG,NG-dimethylarginine dimethylaminohydrolase [Legionella birminghamensis]